MAHKSYKKLESYYEETHIDNAEESSESVTLKLIDNNSLVEALPSPSNNTTITPSSTEPTDPVFFSPYIVCSRRKNNASKRATIMTWF